MLRDTLVAALGLLGIAAIAGCSEPPPSRLDDPAAQQAALRGIGWVRGQRETMAAEWWLPLVVRFYRVVDDEALAALLEAAARETLARTPPRCDYEDPKDPRFAAWEPFYHVVADVLRCQREGRDTGRSVETLERHLAEARHLWREQAGHRLVLAYVLEQAGISGGPSYEAVRRVVRQQCEAALASDQIETCDAYALTHIVLIASDYFRRFVDPGDFPIEVRLIQEAVRRFSPTGIDDVRADFLGEILICQRLLRLPLDDRAREVARHLAARQNADGSWGGPALRSHSTGVIALALLDYTPRLRSAFDGVL